MSTRRSSVQIDEIRQAAERKTHLLRVIEASQWVDTVLEVKDRQANPEQEVEAEDFFKRIETGNVLCNLLAKISPAIAPDSKKIKPSAKAQSFFARDNVVGFLEGCKKLGLRDVDLFEANDLVMRANDRQVINCLLEVSKRAAIRFGISAPLLVQYEMEIDEDNEEDKKDMAGTEEEDMLVLLEEINKQKAAGGTGAPQQLPQLSQPPPTETKTELPPSHPSSPPRTREEKAVAAVVATTTAAGAVEISADDKDAEDEKADVVIMETLKELDDRRPSDGDIDGPPSLSSISEDKSEKTEAKKDEEKTTRQLSKLEINKEKRRLAKLRLKQRQATLRMTRTGNLPYVAAPDDEIDVAVGATVNKYQIDIRIKRVEVKKKKRRREAKQRGKGEYMVGIGTKVHVRLVQGAVLVRDEGAWMDLRTFLEQRCKQTQEVSGLLGVRPNPRS